jgi:hypothetical protein
LRNALSKSVTILWESAYHHSHPLLS